MAFRTCGKPFRTQTMIDTSGVGWGLVARMATSATLSMQEPLKTETLIQLVWPVRRQRCWQHQWQRVDISHAPQSNASLAARRHVNTHEPRRAVLATVDGLGRKK